jgi:hypothetical protein
MRYLLPAGLFLLSIALIVSCKPKDPKPEVVTPAGIKWDIRQVNKKECVNDAQCANFQVYYPLFSGGDSASTAAITTSVQGLILSTVGGNAGLPFEVALDSAGIAFCQSFVQFKRDVPESELGHDLSIVTNILFNNPKVISVEMSGNSFTGGAHPNSFATLVSFDLSRKAQALLPTEIISDTTALLPLLQTAYKSAKGMTESGDIRELLYEGMNSLPMPHNICIIPEGVRFYYSDYEVAPHAVGPADIVLSWEQLGPLVDKSKWIQ